MSILQQSGRHIMTETAQISAVVVEDRERAQIEARRARAEERRQRFLNARERTIGVRLLAAWLATAVGCWHDQLYTSRSD